MTLIEHAVKGAGIHQKANYSGFSHVLQNRIKGGKEVLGVIDPTTGFAPTTKVVRIYVKQKVSLDNLPEKDRIPAKVRFFTFEADTDVVVLDAKALSVNVSKVRPVTMGWSIGHYKITAGSGGFVCWVNGEARIMSNNHVFANQTSVQNVRSKFGDPILQPGPYDGGKYSTTDAGDAIGIRAETIPLDEINVMSPGVDVSLAIPFEEGNVTPNQIVGVGTVVQGQTCKYTGRSSGSKTVTITDPSAQISVQYEGFSATFDDVAVFSPGAIPGDSGSGITDTGANLLGLGLVFAGDQSQNIGILCKLTNVVQAFKAKGVQISFVAPAGPPPPPPLTANTVEFVSYSPTKYTNGIPAETFKVKINYPTRLDFYVFAVLKNPLGQTIDITDDHIVGFSGTNQPPDGILVFSGIGYGSYTLEMFCVTDAGVPVSQPVSTPYTYAP